MRLKVLKPTEIHLDEEVNKITAEAKNGSFCILPKHIDFVTSLCPGILMFEKAGEETCIAVDEGLLVKQGKNVFVSTRNAVRGAQLGDLKKMVEDDFRAKSGRETMARKAAAKIEASFVRRFLDLQDHDIH